MVLHVQQNHKIKTFFMEDTIFWFLKGKKEHTKKFKKWWFGLYKIQYCLPNNTILLINIDKFEPNPILVNINKLNPTNIWIKLLEDYKPPLMREESTRKSYKKILKMIRSKIILHRKSQSTKKLLSISTN